MIRAKIFSIFACLLRIMLIICICKYVFYRDVQVTFPNRNVELYQCENGRCYFLRISNPTNGNYYHVHINPEQVKCWKKNNYYNGKWYEMHLCLHAFWWIFVTGWTAWYIITTINIWSESYCSRTNYFYTNSNDPPSVILRCMLYQYITDYDLTFLKQKFYKFWGY